jgi:ferredoxin
MPKESKPTIPGFLAQSLVGEEVQQDIQPLLVPAETRQSAVILESGRREESMEASKKSEQRTCRLYCFSGTGNTAALAERLAKELYRNDLRTSVQPVTQAFIDRGGMSDPTIKMIGIAFPVYTFNAPLIVEELIDKLPDGRGQPVFLMQTAARVEWANRGASIRPRAMLAARGYRVFYDRTFIMPPNAFRAYPESLCIALIRKAFSSLPGMASDLITKEERLSHYSKLNALVSRLGRGQRMDAAHFGRQLHANEGCTRCGWCVQACPRGNISILEDKPVFGRSCMMCLRCIYGCPRKAIEPTRMKMAMIPGGYHIAHLIAQADGANVEPPLYPRGKRFQRIREYLESE